MHQAALHERSEPDMPQYLAVIPADTAASDAIVALQDGCFGPLSQVRWRVTLLEQATEMYAFGLSARVVADLGEWIAQDSIGDPDWAAIWDRLQVVGWNLNSTTYQDQVVPGGLWLRASYTAPQHVEDYRLMWPVG